MRMLLDWVKYFELGSTQDYLVSGNLEFIPQLTWVPFSEDINKLFTNSILFTNIDLRNMS